MIEKESYKKGGGMKQVIILIGLVCIGCFFCSHAVTAEGMYGYTADAYGMHTSYGIWVATTAVLANH